MGVKTALVVLLAALLAISLTVSQGYAQPTYKLAVKAGDWVEYEVVDAYGPDVSLRRGDKVKLVIKGFDYQDIYDPEGVVVFSVQVAIYDVYVNGQLSWTDQRDRFPDYFPFFFIMFFPIDEAFWRDFDRWLRDYEGYIEQQGGTFDWSIEDKDGFKEVHMEGSSSGGYGENYRATIDMTAGVAIKLRCMTTASGQTWVLELRLYDTNIEGVSLPGGEGLIVKYWWLWALVGGVVVCAIVGVVVAMRRKAPPPTSFTYTAPPASGSSPRLPLDT